MVSVGDSYYNATANLTVSGGTLNVGYGGTNGAILAGNTATAANTNTHFTFSGGAVQNISAATVTSFGATNVCNGTVSGLTGPLTLNCTTASMFTGNVTGLRGGDRGQ